MPPKKSKMPAFEMSAEQALFKERFLQLFAEPRDIKRRKPANEGKEIFSNWDAIFKEYFSKNPESKINRANFDCLIDEVGFTIKDIGLIANGTQHNRYFLSVIEILVANIDALKELKRDVGFGVANIAVILKGSCGNSGGKIKVLKDNIRVFKALAANAD